MIKNNIKFDELEFKGKKPLMIIDHEEKLENSKKIVDPSDVFTKTPKGFKKNKKKYKRSEENMKNKPSNVFDEY